MRPCRRRPSRRPARPRAAAWWWLVAASRACCWSSSPRRSRSGGRATRETRTTSYRVLGDLAGIRLDLGDADVEIDGGATAVEVRRVDRFAFGAPSEERRTVESGTLSIALALPGPGARLLSRLLPAHGARQRPARDPDLERLGQRLAACARRSQVNTGSGAISATGFCGFSLRASSDTGERRRARRVLRRPARAALAQRRRARGRPVRPLPDRRAERLGRGPHPRAHRRADAPFQIQALSTSGDVTVEAAS